MNEFRPILVPLALVFLVIDSLLFGAPLLDLTLAVFAAGMATAVGARAVLDRVRAQRAGGRHVDDATAD